MVYWQPGTQYNLGDVVTYEGADYKIIQPHRSQGDWTPPVTPALWGRMQGGGGGGDFGYNNSDCSSGNQHQPKPQQECKPPQQQWQQPQPQQPQQPQQPPPQYTQKPSGNGSDCSDDEGKSDSKKWLGIGGGIAAGAAILGGGLAFMKHRDNQKDEEEENRWLTDCQRRTEAFYRQGPSAPITWVLNRGKTIPEGAIPVASEGESSQIFISRSFHRGSITPGGASVSCKKGAILGYGHDEIHKDTYEILLGDMRALRWVAACGKLDVGSLGARPVDGGKDTDGTPLYVARAHYKGSYYPGKASERLKKMFFPFDGDEKEVEKYEVLCYA